MIIIGVLLLIAAAVFGVDFVWKNDFHIADPVAFGQHLGIHNASGLFILGAVTGAVALVGLWLLVAGIRHKSSKASTRRREGRDVRTERDRLRTENAELHSELGDQHDDADGGWVEPGVRR